MRAVDTNVLIRLITGDDDTQTATAEQFVRGGVWVSTVVVAEAMWVLANVHKSRPREVAEALDLLLNHPRVSIQDADAVEAALRQFRARPSLGFSDCLILELARKAGHLPLATFDRTLAKIDGAQKI